MNTENIIRKDWRNIDFSFGLIYPNTYKIGMSSYSIRFLYYLINSYENIVCERFFLPEQLKFPASKDYSSLKSLRSIETKLLPAEFDILGFSVQFENDFKNIFWFLDKVNIPLYSLERQESNIEEKKHYPLIIGGGPVITSNPMPLSNIFDVLFIGDCEPNLNSFFNSFGEYNKAELSFQEFLKKLKNVEGLFIPSLDNKVKRATLKNLDESPIPIFQLISKNNSSNSIFEGNFLIEINRGCPYQCKFCISSFHNSPFRNKSYNNIIETIDKGIKYLKFDTISLIGSCISSHPEFKQICEFIIKKGKRLTIPSIRIEHLSSEVIQILEKGNIKTITVAPEAGSEDLRFGLGKIISNEKIISILSQIRNSRIKNIKFYFLIGLPNETDRDIDEIIDLLKNVNELGFEKNTLRVNVNPFIPKLNTPYEKEVDFYFDENKSSFQAKFQKLESELKKIPSIKIKFMNYKSIVKNAKLQTLISLGNQETSKLLFNYYNNGATFGALKRAEKELNFDLNEYLLKIKNCYSPWSV
ncbi:MAG: B12-binding domain-containing radical SAM protein [Promethearchaeota archaeon]